MTREERINKYAYQRWELRQEEGWRPNDTAEDDYREACRIEMEGEKWTLKT